MTVSCAPTKIPSPSNQRLDDPTHRVPFHCRGVARRLPATTHLSARGTASAGFAGVPGPALFDTHHLDQWRPEPQLECGVFSSFPLPMGRAGVVPPHPEARLGALPATTGRGGLRRYASAQNGPLHSASLLSAGSFVASLSPQSAVGPALLASFAAGAAASPCARRHARLADSLSGSLSRPASGQESHRTDAAAVSGSRQTEESVAQLCGNGPAIATATGRGRRAEQSAGAGRGW